MGQNRDDLIQVSGMGPGFFTKVGAACCLLLLVGYGILWSGTVQRSGGADGYVRHTEFLTTMTGAAVVAGPEPALLYDRATQAAAQADLLGGDADPDRLLPYTAPPFAAVLLAGPVRAGAAASVLFTLWAVLTTTAAGLCIGLLAGRWAAPQGTPWMLMLACTSFLPLISALMSGQNLMPAILGWVGVTVGLKSGRDSVAGAAGALAVLAPAVLPLLLLLLLITRRWRALAALAATLALAALAVAPLLGADWPLRYGRWLLESAGLPGANSLPGILPWPAPAANAAGVDSGTVLAVGCALLVLLWTWLPWQGGAVWRPAGVGWDLRWAISLIAVLLPALSLQPNALALAIIPGWILGTHLATGRLRAPRRVYWLAWLWIGYALGMAATLAAGGARGLVIVWLVGALAGLAWNLWSRRVDEPERPEPPDGRPDAAWPELSGG
jgi:hypothetical protein